jgi:hypothetical protein
VRNDGLHSSGQYDSGSGVYDGQRDDRLRQPADLDPALMRLQTQQWHQGVAGQQHQRGGGRSYDTHGTRV